MILEDAYIQFLIEHNLTQSQYLFLHLVYKNRVDLIRKYKEKFPNEDNTMIGQHFIDDLINRGFIIVNKDKTKITLSYKFHSLFINKHLATDEIFNIYPTHFDNNGTLIPLTAMDRNIFANIYDEAISSNSLEHIEVLKDIKYGIEKNILNMGIEKFVKSQYWKTIRPMRIDHLIKEQVNLRADYEF